jgi:hypothetical protein
MPMQITTRMETREKTNTAQNIMTVVITAPITVRETIGEKEITSIIKNTGTMIIIEPINMITEIITITPAMGEFIKGLSITLMC